MDVLTFLPEWLIDNVILILLAAFAAWGLWEILKAFRRDAKTPDDIELPITFGIGGRWVTRAYYRHDSNFSIAWAKEHAKTLSYITERIYPLLAEAYGEKAEASFRANGLIIHHVNVTRQRINHPVTDMPVDGLVILYPDGAVITVSAGADHHNGGAWAWELRNVVRHYHAGIPSGLASEFRPVRPGDEEAKLLVDLYSRRP